MAIASWQTSQIVIASPNLSPARRLASEPRVRDRQFRFHSQGVVLRGVESFAQNLPRSPPFGRRTSHPQTYIGHRALQLEFSS